jgi:hypothetical protein
MDGSKVLLRHNPPPPSNHDRGINVIENPIMSFLHPQNTKSVMLLSHILLNEVREYVQGTVQVLIFHCIFAFGRYLMVSVLPLANSLAVNFNGIN